MESGAVVLDLVMRANHEEQEWTHPSSFLARPVCTSTNSTARPKHNRLSAVEISRGLSSMAQNKGRYDNFVYV